VKNVKVPEWMAQWPEWLPENSSQLEDWVLLPYLYFENGGFFS
jgi:hypothetical protein